jgi:imidazole glycerol phosphate synthase subunit HisF
VRNLGKPVELAGRYFQEGADEVTFLNITGFRDFPMADLPMLEVRAGGRLPVCLPACLPAERRKLRGGGLCQGAGVAVCVAV